MSPLSLFNLVYWAQSDGQHPLATLSVDGGVGVNLEANSFHFPRKRPALRFDQHQI